MPTTTPAESVKRTPNEIGEEAVRDRARRPSATAIAVTAAMLAPLIAGSTLAIVVAARSPLQSAAHVEALVGVIEAVERTDDVQVPVAVEYAPALVAVVATSGTVTAVGVAAGDEIATGTRLVAVDDRDVISYIADAPLYRDLTRGATGRDVSTAQTVLASLGFDPGPVNATLGSATSRAIVAFNKAHGYGSNNPVLSLASLTWVGTSAVTVAEVNAALGTTVSPGSELFTGVASATAIVVTESAAVSTDAPLLLVVGDTSVAYEPGSARVTEAEAVAAIAATIGTATDRVATLRLADALLVGTVPSAAVVTDGSGASCIFADVSSRPVVIDPLGGSLGTVDVDAALIGSAVLLNPRDVRDDLSCAVN